MKTFIFAMVLNLIFLMGCFSTADHLPRVVGGVPIECLILEKEDAEALAIRFDEIIVSNGIVTVVGSLVGLPDRELTIKPSSFLSALASVVLEGKDLGYFRLVSESEFKISSPLPSDRAFATSDLHVSGGSVHFSYSYTGFPSNAILDDETVKRKAKIRFQSQAIVSYYVRNIIEVRFSDEDYSYPKADCSIMNIRGAGKCLMRISCFPQ